MASYRIQQYGRSAVVQGDLILDMTATAHGLADEAADSSHDWNVQSADDAGSGTRDHVRCVSNHEREIYRLKDVFLPLPGYDVQYPANDVGEK